MSLYCTPLRRRSGLPLKRKLDEPENIAALTKEKRKALNEKECHLEKLKFLAKQKEQHQESELNDLIKTWRNVTCTVLVDLYKKTTDPKPTIEEFLETLRLDKSKLGPEVLEHLNEEIL